MFGRSANFSCMLHPDDVSNLAVTTFFDFTAAFPSVSHAWLFQVLKSIRMPRGLLYLVKAMYLDNRAYVSLNGSVKYLFTVTAGVLQGCPLSAALFNFALDPLLWLFAQVVVEPGLGHVFACADDLAAVLRSLANLSKVAKCFEIFQNIANLTLNPKKCIIVLNSVEASPHNISIIRQWLSANIPAWAEFGIANSAKYLGFVLGPRAGAAQWTEPLKKFMFRVDQIARSGDSAAVSFRQYSSKAVSVLGYVAQLIPPPANIDSIELGAMNKVGHMATNSISRKAFHYISEQLGLGARSLKATLQASLLRTALATCSDFGPSLSLLHDSALECMPVKAVISGGLSPFGWDSSAIVHNLYTSTLCTNLSNNQQLKVLPIICKFRSAPFGRLQHALYCALVESAEIEWIELLGRRIATLCTGTVFVPHEAAWWFAWHLRAASPSIKVIMLRTVSNSWATSHRVEQCQDSCCVFGCGLVHPLVDTVPKDNLQHYLICPILWKIVRQLVGEDASSVPFVLLCLTPRYSDFRPVALAHCIYHGIRLGCGGVSGGPRNRVQMAQVVNNAIDIARVAFLDMN